METREKALKQLKSAFFFLNLNVNIAKSECLEAVRAILRSLSEFRIVMIDLKQKY